VTALELAFKLSDGQSVQLLLQHTTSSQNRLRLAVSPRCLLQEVVTGSNDRFAYGVTTRKVNMSRQGKEGNNALVADLNNVFSHTNWFMDEYQLQRLLETPTDPELFEQFKLLSGQQVLKRLFERIHYAVRSGNLATAGYLVKLAILNDGYGFNKVHEEVLTAKKPQLLSEVGKTSLTKKNVTSMGSKGGSLGLITPLHCACINPNPEFLRVILERVEDFNLADDI